MSGPYARPNNDPFQGGSYQPLRPPNGGSAGFPPPGASSGPSLADNVSGGAPFLARNNRGSNISIPYARIVSVASNEFTQLDKADLSHENYKSLPPSARTIRETDDLRKFRLAWIAGESAMYKTTTPTNFKPSNFNGVNRTSRLCSSEYLKRYFESTLRNASIQLSLRYDHEKRGGESQVGFGNSNNFTEKAMFPKYTTGLLGSVTRPAKKRGMSTSKGLDDQLLFFSGLRSSVDSNPYVAITEGDYNRRTHKFQTPLIPSSSMTVTSNITYALGSRDMGDDVWADKQEALDSDAVRSRDNRKQRPVDGKAEYPTPDRNYICGIYPRPLGPFLHGRTLLDGMSAITFEGESGDPIMMADAMGDHVAFTALYDEMQKHGVFDWKPDGVVNSKLENGPDKQADDYFDERDGQLFNVHVQGPATCSNWAGTEFSRSAVAGDKLFVAIVADCWVGCGDKQIGNKEALPGERYLQSTSQYMHLPIQMQDFYAKESEKQSSEEEKAAVAKMRYEILTRHAEAKARVMTAAGQTEAADNTRARELMYHKLSALVDMRKACNDDTNRHDYHSTVSANLLRNFRIRHVTSSEMVETSALALDAEGGVAMDSNGGWPKGSRMGLAFSKVQLRNNARYNEDFDIWLDPDASINEAIVRGAGAEVNMKTALEKFSSDRDLDALKTTVGPNLRGPPPGTALHEVIVGAWHIGTMLDTAASRGTGRGFAVSRNDSAVSMNVNVEWWSGDRLYKHFANRPGTGKTFSIRTQPSLGSRKDTDQTALSVYNTSPTKGLGGSDFNVMGSMAERNLAQYVNINSNDTGKFTQSDDTTVLEVKLNLAPATLGGGVLRINGDGGTGFSYPQLSESGTLKNMTDLQLKKEALEVARARANYPDPWDLPASAPLCLKDGNTNQPKQDRDAYYPTKRIRAAWDTNQTNAQGKLMKATFENVHVRQVIVDPGNKFFTKGPVIEMGAEWQGQDFDEPRVSADALEIMNQGNIVAFYDAYADHVP